MKAKIWYSGVQLRCNASKYELCKWGCFETKTHTLNVFLCSWQANSNSKLTRAFHRETIHNCRSRDYKSVGYQLWRSKNPKCQIFVNFDNWCIVPLWKALTDLNLEFASQYHSKTLELYFLVSKYPIHIVLLYWCYISIAQHCIYTALTGVHESQ